MKTPIVCFLLAALLSALIFSAPHCEAKQPLVGKLKDYYDQGEKIYDKAKEAYDYAKYAKDVFEKCKATGANDGSCALMTTACLAYKFFLTKKAGGVIPFKDILPPVDKYVFF